MKVKIIHPDLVKIITLLLILAISILWVTYRGLAQDLPPQIEDNSPGQMISPGQENPFTAQSGEDNNSGLAAGSAPDLVITDPGTDLLALVKSSSQINSVYSSVIPAAEFTVNGWTRSWLFGFSSAYIYPTGAGGYCGIAPLFLPDGSTVTTFGSYVLDDDAMVNIDVYLYAKPLGSTTSSTTMASVASEGQSAALQLLVDDTLTQAVIDNDSYTYHIGICLLGLDNSLRFYASQVIYSR